MTGGGSVVASQNICPFPMVLYLEKGSLQVKLKMTSKEIILAYLGGP